MRFQSLVLLSGIVAVVCVRPLAAQTTTGILRGYVTDSGQAPLSGVQLTAHNVANGSDQAVTSQSNGFYALAGLSPGDYDLTVRRVGMVPQRQRVQVQVGAVLTADFRLAASAVEIEAVTVTAATTVETRTSEVATNVTSAQVSNLPTLDRNFLDLAALAPGVLIQNTRLDGQRRTFSAGAQNPEAINVFIDGANYKNDVLQGGVAGQDASRGNPFPLNAVQEFRVLTQNYKAEYQDASSAVIAATTRSGGNSWNGSAFYSGMGTDYIARDPFLASNVAKPDFKRNMLGATLGGPIIRDRLHFFGSYEGNYQNRYATVNYGAATQVDTVDLTRYNGSFLSPFRSNLFFGKLSYTPADHHALELSVNTRAETDIRDFGTHNSYEQADNVNNHVNTAVLKYRGLWGLLLNESSVSLQRYDWNPVPLNPQLVNRNYEGIGILGGYSTEQAFRQDRIAFRNDVTYSGLHWGGAHVVKGGATADVLNYNVAKQLNGNPTFFYNADTALGHYDAPYATPYKATFGFGSPDMAAHNFELGAYLQDDWNPTKHLQINLGLRWDYESDMLNNDYVTPQGVRDSLQLPIFRDSVLFPIGPNYFTDGTQRPPFLGAFQPRLGFSYAFDSEEKTTLFGGFGIFYDRDFYNATLDELYRRQYKVLTYFFSSDGSPTSVSNGQNTIAWQDSYLSKDGLQGLVANGQAPKPEVFLIDNNTRPPMSRQWSVGLRHVQGQFVFSATYAGVRSFNGLSYIFGNRRANGNCCYQNATLPFTNVLLSSDDVRTWYDAFYFKIDRPYRGGHTWSWGAGLSYTRSKAQHIGGDLFSLDHPTVQDYPRLPTTSDERNHVVANWILDFPLGVQFSGLLTLGSGVPYTVTDQRLGAGAGQTQTVYVRPPQYDFLIPNAWAYRDVDLRLRKTLPRVGGTQLSLIAEVYNVFNYHNYGGYGGTIGTDGSLSANYGRPGSIIADPRYAQIGAQYEF